MDKLPRPVLLKIAAEVDCDPRTVDSAWRGGRVYPLLAKTIAKAFKRAGVKTQAELKQERGS